MHVNMASNNMLVYITVWCAIIAELYALDECKDMSSTCKRRSTRCTAESGVWTNFMEKICMSTCRYCTTENVALGKTTKQSSSLVQTGHNSSNAVDGEIQDKYGFCSITSNSDVKSWWCVDLEKQYTINKINVYYGINDNLTNFTVILSNTASCDEATLRSSPVCYKVPGSNRNPYGIDRCNEGNVDFNGRFVFITTDKEYTSLGLCEVEVYSARCSDGYYENRGRCSRCNCDGEPCDPDTGRCLQKCPINCKNDKCDVAGRCTDGCNVGFYGSDCTGKCSPNCKNNVCTEAGLCSDCRDGFYGDLCSKKCSNCKPGGCKRDSGVCTNGCLGGFYGSDGLCLRKCPNCLPGGCDKDTGVCIIGCIEGWYKDTCDARCSSDCQGGCNRLTGTCTACFLGRYGDTCQHVCSYGCQGGCNRFTGTCAACSLGRYGDNCQHVCSNGCQGGCTNGICTACSPGRYGDTCQHECINGCQGGCHRSNGTCTSCSPGRYGDYCQHECSNGCLDNICNKNGSCSCKATHYGDNCNITCSVGCMNNECSSNGGFCLCKGTHYGEKCEQECSNKCIDRQCTASSESSKPRCTGGCINGYKGSYCQSPCPVNCVTCNTTVCSVCKRRWYGNTCQTPCPIICPNQCDSVSGECEQCLGNTFGRFCNSTCSDRCRSQGTDKTCNIAGDCLFGCVDGNYGNSCDKLCSPGCNTGCDQNGKCHNCNQGYHGDKCDLKCAKFCRRGCRRQDGRCIDCIPGYYGNYCNNSCSSTCLEECRASDGYCNKCMIGSYGRTCKQKCSKTCEGGCDRGGKCLRCSKGFYDDNCDKNCSNNCIDSDCERPTNYLECSKGCVEGKTGRYCSRNCLKHCINCHQFNRYQCSACEDGWSGTYCNQPCPNGCIKCDQNGNCLSCKSGFFGERCDDPCPTGCLDDSCNLNGTCISCNTGYFGPMCNEICPIGCLDDICNMDGTCEACKHGYYGITCDKMCSTNCKSSTGLTVCNITDGSCIDDCGDGTSGQNCKEDCEMGYYGSNCDKVCHCYQSQCDQDTGVCDYGCEHGWMGFRCDQVKAPAEVATYCFNSPTKGKYAQLRVDTKSVKYDKIYIINESQDTSSSTTCDQGMFNEDADGVLNLRILIEDDNTFPSCYYTKTDRGIFKWTLRTEEVSGFYSYYDRLYELSCDFTTAEPLTRNHKQSISGIYQPSKVKITQTTEDVQLFIQNPATTSRVSQVQIGSRIQLAMLLNKRDGITASGISPYNCSCSTPDGKTVHKLTDSSGCPVRNSPVYALTGSNGSYLTSNIFDAFTVEGSLGLIFSCSFEFCFDSNDTKCTDRCSDQRTQSILEITSRTKRSANGNRKNGQASTYLLLIPKTQKDKQTDMNNISIDSEGTVSKHLTVITSSILVLVLCGGLVAVVLLVRSSRITVMKQTNVKITE